MNKATAMAGAGGAQAVAAVKPRAVHGALIHFIKSTSKIRVVSS
jgi:hypothetical protein